VLEVIYMASESKDQPASINGGAQLVTGPVLARWLGISGKAVYDLAKSGVLARITRDQFSLEESVRRYCEHLRQSASQQSGSNVQGVQGVASADPSPAPHQS